MNFELKSLGSAGLANYKTDALVVLVEDKATTGSDPLAKLVQQARKSGDLADKAGSQLILYRVVGVQAPFIQLVMVADGSARHVRSAVTAAVAAFKGKPVKKLAIAFTGKVNGPALRSVVQAVSDATYCYTATKSKAEATTITSVVTCATNAAACKEEFHRAVAIAKGVDLAREWANRPGNHATPTHLAKAAKDLAGHAHITCDVLGPKDVAKLGMGAFTAVAKGSSEPLRFIVLQYRGAAKAQAPQVLVGKGITFDSGGISIKPAPEMDEMKFDMSGAASVLGVFRALAELQPKINVVGLIPSCENLPGPDAVKPGDVVTSMSGQTIEILNTDAEGRLILCDALHYAERFKPAAVVDIATLTGACVIALGATRSGMFASDDALANALTLAGERAQDLCWRMPLDDEYAEGLKSNFADVANVAGRAAGAVTAAKFLQRFVGKYPWAHLDIAGTAWKSGGAKGGTGRPVGLLVEYLLSTKDTAR